MPESAARPGSHPSAPVLRMISQIFILSLRGDNIIFRDYRSDVPKTSAEVFFRNFKFWKEQHAKASASGTEPSEEETPPVFNVDGVNYLWIKGSGRESSVAQQRGVVPVLVFLLLGLSGAAAASWCRHRLHRQVMRTMQEPEGCFPCLLLAVQWHPAAAAGCDQAYHVFIPQCCSGSSGLLFPPCRPAPGGHDARKSLALLCP